MTINSVVEAATPQSPGELKRIEYLDGWRGIAILLVLISHFMSLRGINIGRMGVDVFFVLSGMLMSNILFVKKVKLSTFYKRRFSRILPVFIVYLVVVSAASWLLSLSSEHTNFFYNLFFIRAYFPTEPDLWNTGMPVGHLWSLYVEEHAYVLLSIITLLPFVRRKPYILLFLLAAVSISLQYVYIIYPSISPSSFHLRTEIAISFILLSSGYYLIKHKIEKFIPNWLPIATSVMAFTCYDSSILHWSADWTIAPFLLAFSVNHLNLIPAFFKKMLSFSPLRLLGIWSFSIYLWQQPLYFYYNMQSIESLSFLGLILMFLSIAIGATSFYLIENPTRNYLNNKW